MSEFRALDMILAKRAGGRHTQDQLERLMDGYVSGQVPDYQVSAWLMAVCWRGMTDSETTALTQAMARSGDMLDLAGLPHTVDKHSTGGVGDKTTLVLAPLLAAMGGTVAKMSGRGLGHTGGTVDKLESIPGFRAALSERAFLEQAHRVGVVVTGQSLELAPADGKLYALRDASGTVESLPLIASSIMSKKLAGGADSMVLDVKVGSGAFMKSLKDARQLARIMVTIGQQSGRRMRAVISDMSEPLGFMVGNALEVEEAISCLKGEGPADLLELCLALASEVLEAAGLPSQRAELLEAIGSGRAYAKFEEWIAAQGGDVTALGRLERAPDRWQLRAGRSGVVSRVTALDIGRAAGMLGGGRSRKDDVIDMGVGVQLHAKVGDEVQAGQPLATLHHRGARGLDEAKALLEEAIEVAGPDQPVARPALLLERGIGA